MDYSPEELGLQVCKNHTRGRFFKLEFGKNKLEWFNNLSIECQSSLLFELLLKKMRNSVTELFLL